MATATKTTIEQIRENIAGMTGDYWRNLKREQIQLRRTFRATTNPLEAEPIRERLEEIGAELEILEAHNGSRFVGVPEELKLVKPAKPDDIVDRIEFVG